MARGRKQKLIENVEDLIEMPQEPQNTVVETIEFYKALRMFKKQNIDKARVMEDSEVVRLFAIKYVPSLVASKEDWNKIFNKF